MNRTRPTQDRIPKLCFFAGLLGFAFLLGSVLAHWNHDYSKLISDAIRAFDAKQEQQEIVSDPFPRYLWYPESRSERGVLHYDPEKCFSGLTLCLSGEGGQATLLDPAGVAVHTWDVAFNRIWPNAPQIQSRTPDHVFHIRRAHVFPNGDLLALYESPVHTPYGVGLAKLDREGQVIWKLDENAHHDFSLGEDGRIYVLTHRIRHEPMSPVWDRLQLPIIEEFVTIVSANGKVEKRLSLFDLIEHSPHHRPNTTNSTHYGDVLHSNTVNVIGKGFASHYDEITPGDLMVCLRDINLVIVINPEQDKIVWSTSGPWRFPHDPDPLDNGRILIFDNCYTRGVHDGSRVVEFDPQEAGLITWQYVGSPQSTFKSGIRSVQQRLPNGNILITESDHGRIFEVTREGEIVWDYVHTTRGGDDGKLIPVLCGGHKYSHDELPFLMDDGRFTQVK